MTIRPTDPLTTVVAFAAAVTAAVLAGGPARLRADEAAQGRWFKYLMGTSMRVDVYGGDAAAREAAANEAFAVIAEVDRLMSDYRADSELTAINAGAAAAPVRASAPLMAVLHAAARVSGASDGAFDVTVGPLVRLWGFKDKTPHVPSGAELDAVRPLVDYRAVVLDDRAQTVRFARPGMSIDLGGIAKGFAVEVAAAAIQRRGLSGVVDAGGNQFVVGTPPGKREWSIGIRDPEHPDQLLGVIHTGAGAISTSSDASNFLVDNGRRYGHILDPRTLRPAGGTLSVTIVSADGTLSDALSKAMFVMGPARGIALAKSFPGTEALIVSRDAPGDAQVAMTPGLTAHFQSVNAGPQR